MQETLSKIHYPKKKNSAEYYNYNSNYWYYKLFTVLVFQNVITKVSLFKTLSKNCLWIISLHCFRYNVRYFHSHSFLQIPTYTSNMQYLKHGTNYLPASSSSDSDCPSPSLPLSSLTSLTSLSTISKLKRKWQQHKTIQMQWRLYKRDFLWHTEMHLRKLSSWDW